MSNRYRQSDIPQIPNKNVFFDANVLIYVFWPTLNSDSNSPAIRYSSILGTLFRNGFKLYLNSTIVSEAINRVLRIEYEKYKVAHNVSNLAFKDYRDSADGMLVQQDVFGMFNNRILNLFSVKEKCLTKDMVKSFLTIDSLDFNDKIIVDICKSNGFVLLTHDKDFANEDVDIISANGNFFTNPTP